MRLSSVRWMNIYSQRKNARDFLRDNQVLFFNNENFELTNIKIDDEKLIFGHQHVDQYRKLTFEYVSSFVNNNFFIYVDNNGLIPVQFVCYEPGKIILRS